MQKVSSVFSTSLYKSLTNAGDGGGVFLSSLIAFQFLSYSWTHLDAIHTSTSMSMTVAEAGESIELELVLRKHWLLGEFPVQLAR